MRQDFHIIIFHSIHTQAQETFNNHPPNYSAFAAPPLAMRQRRAPAQLGDSGNMHWTHPTSLRPHKKKTGKLHARNPRIGRKLTKQKCRSHSQPTRTDK